MSNFKMVKTVLREYGIGWLACRILYSIKINLMRIAPVSEKIFEKDTAYPKKLDLFQIDIRKIRELLQNLDEKDKSELIATADDICKGIIKAFSSIELDYGSPIDWQMNPLTGRRCNENEKWYRIPDFSQERGDIKVIWEASRFSHLITLARAYLLTNNRKYYQAFSEQIADWLKQNTYSRGANFKCGQECSLRMVNALLAFTVFRNAGVATDADVSNVLDLIDRCYRKVLSNFFYAHKCIKNNHTISELMGMIVGAWCCENQKQINRAYRWLDKSIDEQFLDDGGYKQFSFNYQRLVLQDLECILSVTDAIGKNISNVSKNKIYNAAYMMYQCQDINGDLPNYGSNDGALIFPITSCQYRDFRPVINTIFALIKGHQVYDEGKHQEELIWFSGGKDLVSYRYQNLQRCSSQFTQAGLFTLREEKAWLMFIANDYHSRPAHMDQNHIDLWIDGKNVLCDAGTYSYANEGAKVLVKNESHNTIVVNGVTQMNSSGPFLIYDWTRRKLGEINGSLIENTIVSKNGYSHIRRVEKTDDGYAVTDLVDKEYFVMFHTPYKVIVNGRNASIIDGDKEICTISSNGDLSIECASRSLYYLKKEVVNCIKIIGNAKQKLITNIKVKEIRK